MADTSSQQLPTRRLESFTDGVFAIAATLLVLDLSVDSIGKVASSAGLWHALGGMSSQLVAFAISFGLLCMLWTLHVRQFERITVVDSVLIGLNSLRLFGVVVIPFTTSLSSAYDDTWLGRTVLPINFLFVMAVTWGQWFWATRDRGAFVHDMSADEVRDTRAGAFRTMIYGVVSVAAAPFIGPWAFFAYALDAVYAAVTRPGRARRAAERAAAGSPAGGTSGDGPHPPEPPTG